MAQDTNGLKELETLFPGRRLKVMGEEILVRTFTLTQIPKATGILSKYSGLFQEISGTLATDGAVDPGRVKLDVPRLVMELGDDVLELVTMCTGKDRKWLDQLPGDLGTQLLVEVFEENTDFLAKYLVPTLTKAMEKMAAPSDGESASPA